MGISSAKKMHTNINAFSQIQAKWDSPVKHELKLIMNWSFEEIRQVCRLYKRYSEKNPYLSKFKFKKILSQLSSSSCNQIFNSFVQKRQKFVSFYEFICALVLLSFNTTKRKLQFLYLVFNFTHDKSLKLKHYLLMFYCMTFGFSRVINQEIPKFSILKQFLLSEYDVSSQQFLCQSFQLASLIQIVQNREIINKIFKRFEQDLMGAKQKPYIYMYQGLVKHTKNEEEKLFSTFKKAYQQNNYEDIQIQQQKKILRLQTRRKQKIKSIQSEISKKSQFINFRTKKRIYTSSNVEKERTSFINYEVIKHRNSAPNLRMFNFIKPQSPCQEQINQFNKNQQIRKRNFLFQDKFQSLEINKFPSISNSKQIHTRIKTFTNSNTKSIDKRKISQILQKKIPSVIFSKGKILSKQHFFEYIEYFNTLSNYKDQINIHHCLKNLIFFENKQFHQKNLLRILKFFDTNSTGKISFKQFIKINYPMVNDDLFQKIQKQNLQYKQIYSIQSNKIPKKMNIQKIQLPEQTKQRIKQIFISFGGNKGFLLYEDLKNAYSEEFSIQEYEKIVKQYGDQGKIFIEGFTRMLLPQNFTIQNCDWNIKKP